MKQTKNFVPVNGQKNFDSMRSLISEKIQNELMSLLQDQRSLDLLLSLMNVVYQIINEHFKSNPVKNLGFDIDEFINSMLYSASCIILKVKINYNYNYNYYLVFFFNFFYKKHQ